jgi:hypothetical protein
MDRLEFTYQGPYDQAIGVVVERDGRWEAFGGSYITRGSRHGRLRARDRRRLMGLVASLPDSSDTVPDEADGFIGELTCGTRRIRWLGPIPKSPALAGLIRRLRAL